MRRLPVFILATISASCGPKVAPPATAPQANVGAAKPAAPPYSVRVESARVGKVILRDAITGEAYESEEVALRLVVSISSTSQTLLYRDRDDVSLSDDLGSKYRRVRFPGCKIAGEEVKKELYPGESITDVWAFSRPVNGARELVLKIGAVTTRFPVPGE